MCRNLSECLVILRSNFEALRRAYKIKSLHIFGSVARGTNRNVSDVDILVSFADTPTLFILASLENDLSELLRCPVDLVLDSELAQPARDRIIREMVEV